ncbi:hypothetical protein T484DRAFT_1621887, partial [Baffinella frigidus]
NPKPQTPNPKPQTPNPKPQTPNPKPQTPNPKPQTPNPKPQTPNPKPQTPNPQLQTEVLLTAREAHRDNPRSTPNLSQKTSFRTRFLRQKRVGNWSSHSFARKVSRSLIVVHVRKIP